MQTRNGGSCKTVSLSDVFSLCNLIPDNGTSYSVCQCLFTHKRSGELHAPSGAARLHLSCQNRLVATSETQRSLGSNWRRPFKHNGFILGHGASLSLTSSSHLRTLPACCKSNRLLRMPVHTNRGCSLLFALRGERCLE